MKRVQEECLQLLNDSLIAVNQLVGNPVDSCIDNDKDTIKVTIIQFQYSKILVAVYITI